MESEVGKTIQGSCFVTIEEFSRAVGLILKSKYKEQDYDIFEEIVSEILGGS